MSERVPQNVQNTVIREYCIKNNFQYLLSVTEYAMDNSSCVLQELVENLSDIDGIVLYSLFQLPKDQRTRLHCLSKIISSNKQLHFASESIKVVTELDVHRLELIWFVRKGV